MCHTFLASLQQIFQNPLDDFHTQWYFSCKSHCVSCKWPHVEGLFPMKILPSRNTPDSFCRLIHPTKSFAMLHGRYFSFTGNAPWKSHEPTERDTDFSSTSLHKQGQELRSEQTVTPLHEQHHLYLFLRLNNSETFVENAFWAQR